MQIVYAMEVVDPLASQNGTKYVRRFTFETREEAWAKYREAIRFGFEATVEQVGRIRSSKETASAWTRQGAVDATVSDKGTPASARPASASTTE